MKKLLIVFSVLISLTANGASSYEVWKNHVGGWQIVIQGQEGKQSCFMRRFDQYGHEFFIGLGVLDQSLIFVFTKHGLPQFPKPNYAVNFRFGQNRKGYLKNMISSVGPTGQGFIFFDSKLEFLGTRQFINDLKRERTMTISRPKTDWSLTFPLDGSAVAMKEVERCYRSLGGTL
ncbi:MAG: hypothetical protein OXH90_02910 [Paracoccaceae bacterium]|nr:hypothetical protein [Paracoccaceae bacterium]MDE2916536.1 hypothetical protein [Paracoccaceae bacterium]